MMARGMKPSMARLTLARKIAVITLPIKVLAHHLSGFPTSTKV